MKFQPVCNPTIRKNFQEYSRSISHRRTSSLSAFVHNGPFPIPSSTFPTIGTPNPFFSCTKAIFRCRLSTECYFRRTKQLFIKLCPPEGIFGWKKMSCNGQSTHNSHFILANQIILFTFAIGFSWQGEASSELIE